MGGARGAPRRAERARRRGDRSGRTQVSDGAVGRVALLSSGSGRVLAAVAGGLALLTVVGLVLLWPGSLPAGAQHAFGGRSLAARVTTEETGTCRGTRVWRGCGWQLSSTLQGLEAPGGFGAVR